MQDSLASFLAFAAVATLTPGGATVIAAALGVRFGYRQSLPSVIGTAAGVALLMAASAAGIAALLLAAPALHFVLRAAATVYLLWLALQIARSGPPDGIRETAAVPAGFVGGFFLLWVNPKA